MTPFLFKMQILQGSGSGMSRAIRTHQTPTRHPDGDNPKAGPSKPATRSRTKAKEALTQTNPHKGSQTERKTQKRPRSPKDPRQLPLTEEPPQKVATISATRAEQLEDLIRALGQNQAATNAMLGRIERGQDLDTSRAARFDTKNNGIGSENTSFARGQKRRLRTNNRRTINTPSTWGPHTKPPGGPGALGIFWLKLEDRGCSYAGDFYTFIPDIIVFLENRLLSTRDSFIKNDQVQIVVEKYK